MTGPRRDAPALRALVDRDQQFRSRRSHFDDDQTGVDPADIDPHRYSGTCDLATARQEVRTLLLDAMAPAPAQCAAEAALTPQCSIC